MISIGPPITEEQPFKKLKILSFMVPFISKIKTADMFNFLSIKYFGKGLLFLKTWHIRVNYCWNYEPLNLLFCFFRYRLDILITDRQKWQKTREYIFLKARTKTSSLTDPPQNEDPLIFFQNWMEITF